MKGAVDVAIIGASIGGSTAALSLLRGGASVVLVDKVDFPRRKSCGEGLSSIGLKELGALGIDLSTSEEHPYPYHGFAFYDGGARSEVKIEGPGRESHGVGIRRFHLDNHLIHEVAKRGGAVLLGEEPAVIKVGDFFCIRTHGITKFAKYIIFATGAYSKIPDSVGIPRIPGSGSRCAVRIDAHLSVPNFKGLLPVVLDDKFQAVCTPVRPHQVTIGVMSRHEDGPMLKAKSLSDITRKIEESVGAVLTVTDEPIGVPSIAKWTRPAMRGAIFCIGDAHRQLDPIGGMGMTQAIMSGRVASDTILKMLHAPHGQFVFMEQERKERIEKAVGELSAYTKLIYAALAHPVGRATLGLLKSSPLAREIIRHECGTEFPKTPTGIASKALLYLAGKL